MTTNKDHEQEGKDREPRSQEEKPDKLKDDKAKESGKSVEPVLASSPKENTSIFFKATTFVSMVIAVLALFLVLAVMKKVDNNMGQLKSSVKKIETRTTSFKMEMDEKLGYVDFEINDLKSKVKKSQRVAAITELKRALVTVQEVSNIEESPELQVKSNQLLSNIESFLQDLGETKKNTPAGTIEVMEEPASNLKK